MNEREIDLESVNWERGMLLTPEHFVRQERYVDSLLSWVLRYSADAYGLVGAGPRIEPAERGAVKHDPVFNVYDDGETVNVSVTQCRGISPSGDIIDIDPAHPVHQPIPKKELEGQRELGVYVVAEPHAKFVGDGAEDANNPQMKSSRRRRHEIRLSITGAEAAHSILLTRLRQNDNLRFERVGDFIPVCTTLVGHSTLMRAWERLRDQLSQLADRYARLHKAISEYINLAGERRINTREDEATLQFVGRMVVALEGCLYEVMSPLQSPQRFLQQMYRVVRSAAVYLDLSPPACDYFRQLAEAGESEFSSLLEQERQTLLTNRELTMHDNLSVNVQQIEEALFRLRRLEEALEGKYWDFRLSTALESLNFFFDRQYNPPALFQSSAKPSRPQMFGRELTFVFAPRNLEERQKYRLILIGRSETPLEVGRVLTAEVRINVGSGQTLEPMQVRAECELPEQRNFALDFTAPSNIQTISDLRVVVNANLPIKSCLLYVRRLIQPVESHTPYVDERPPRTRPAPQPQSEPQPRVRPVYQNEPQPGTQPSTPHIARRRRMEPVDTDTD